ncbi:MAG: hypothetical protein ACHQ0Y_15630, partial [Thermodesulfovibrionales bacterium]
MSGRWGWRLSFGQVPEKTVTAIIVELLILEEQRDYGIVLVDRTLNPYHVSVTTHFRGTVCSVVSPNPDNMVFGITPAVVLSVSMHDQSDGFLLHRYPLNNPLDPGFILCHIEYVFSGTTLGHESPFS